MQPERVVETCLYVDDVEQAAAWYQEVLGLEQLSLSPPRDAMLVAGSSMLLLFNPEESQREQELPPGEDQLLHGARGSVHVALGVDELAPWRDRLSEHGVEVVAERAWSKDARSIYFHDPDGNLVELVTRGLWPVW